ncbi:MAG TPA: hypothetical protein VJV79_20330 [Polyangiaceae bacterium]|nr:hypothetical protein [Polyangiaceae bacterium]
MLSISNSAQRFQRKACSTLGVALILLLAHARPASAEASASDRATARGLAGEGYAALKKKDYLTAEDRFRRADELVHAPTLVLDHARALVGLGRFGEAYAAYDSVTREALPPNAPAVWKRAVKEASVEIETVRPKVAWLTLRVKGTSQPQVEIDGRALPSERLGERLPETPGELRIVVSAPGFSTQSIQQPLSAGEEKLLEISLLPIPEPPPEVVVVPPARAKPSEPAREERPKARRTLTYVSFGVAGLGVAVGTATGILWLNARNDIDSACGGLTCQPQNATEQARYEEDKRRYDTFGTLSAIGFGVGLAGAATGVALLLTQPKEPAEAQTKQASIHPYVGPGVLGVYGAFQ